MPCLEADECHFDEIDPESEKQIKPTHASQSRARFAQADERGENFFGESCVAG